MATAQRASFAVVVERDTTRRNVWAAMLRKAGMRRVLRRARPGEMSDLIAPGTPLTAMIVGLSAHMPRDDDMLALIASTRRHAPDAVILAVDHGNRPRGAAEAFAAGADDALRADHDPSELQARLAVRLQSAAQVSQRAARLVQLGLTPIEERIFVYLNAHRDEIVDRPTLARVLGEETWAYGDRRFDVHIVRIRQKLEAHFGDSLRVRTIRAQGYVLEGEARF
ncbi:helix-turn-helix domain-containing protein [Salipiger abyssi]|uniref:Response regulator with CheY-like receiver domain and winged-helix DNA-binding domain n=1 Tax=Salipiger abyssi TaxID=1250539 RepID=A0A1P8ULT0_9RHOB|nr:helix-turn-helix domain-containing protein [Salipiger abyssi]APZ50352.1 response regulator with CheY-like receiver domain and winged-helix DNA-binding domain [Salipiger abyssi]